MNIKVEGLIINSCLRIAKKGKGALIVLGGEPRYKLLVKQNRNKLINIQRNRKNFEKLAIRDGAIILREDGLIKNYGAMIESSKVFKNYGTRHSAGLTASLMKARVFLVSEQEKKIKVFERGKLVMQIDALQKGVEKNIPEIVKVLQSIGVGTVGVWGATAVGIVGIQFIPGVLVVGGSYFVFNKLRELKLI